MKIYRGRTLIAALSFLACASSYAGAQTIPSAAWKRPLGQPLESPGRGKPEIPYRHFDDGYNQGAPVGGLGAGTFSRSYGGDFVRWHIKTGVHKYQNVPANQFVVYEKAEGQEAVTRALSTGDAAGGRSGGWPSNYPAGEGDYYALYPKAWFDYRWDKFPARLTVEQFSPIIPNNYRESSYPVALYYWHAQNPGKQRVTVSIMFSWTNMVGWFRDFSPNFSQANNVGNVNHLQTQTIKIDGRDVAMKGIVFDRMRQTPVAEGWDGQFAIASAETPGVQISYVTTVQSDGINQALWAPFSRNGRLPNTDEGWASSGEALSGAIAVTFTLEPGENKLVPMTLSWDLPVVEFGQGRKWLRHYTDFFDASGTNAWAIARAGLEHGQDWNAQIDRWQAPYANDESKPLWYRGMLFNEMYTLADNGALWGRPVGAPKSTPPAFTYLECFDYPFYDSLDVRFYGSMPLAKFWPDIEKGNMIEFAKTVPEEFKDKHLWGWKTQSGSDLAFEQRKVRGALPHDLGSPLEDPIFEINQYNWQETSHWKDMNTKFALLVYRDFVTSGSTDMEFLRKCWPAVHEALDYMRQFDHGSGLPENEGYPDQTYDVWTMKGESAYCGGLYLAALRAGEEMAKLMREPEVARQYHTLFEHGRKSFIEKLWNGEYFRYDTGSEYRENVMADQLCGQWYANLTGLGDLVPPEMIRMALHKVYDFNVMKFQNGEMGAVNGIGADGKVLSTNEQVEEVWSGTTLGLASLMLSEGLTDEGFHTAWGIYHVVYERYGYWFRTPEAWNSKGEYRASMYMRPGAIWAMEMIPKPARPAQAQR
jgi:non-lysosomal glucosylceramidase